MSTFTGQERHRKGQPVKVQHYYSPNINFVNFQTDLYEIAHKYGFPKRKVYVCIDMNTKYLLFTFPRSPTFKDLTLAYKNLISQIRKLQNPLLSQIKDQAHIQFYADRSGEYISKKFHEFLKTQNASIAPLSTGNFKAGVISRVSRTLNNLLEAAFQTDPQWNNRNKLHVFNSIVKSYNSNQNTSLKGRTPLQASKHFIQSYPWGKLDYKYDVNTKNVSDKSFAFRKIYPILSTVRIRNIKGIKENIFAKKAATPYFTKELYVVRGYKYPLLSAEPMGVRLMHKNGNLLEGIFYAKDIRFMESPDYSRHLITSIKSMFHLFGMVFFIVNFDKYGTMKFKISYSELRKFNLSKLGHQQLKYLGHSK